MRIHYLQHVPFENLANIEQWVKDRGHTLSNTKLFANDQFVSMSEFDILIVLGGPMNIYEEEKYPWLVEEKRFIERAIKEDKIVLGICLGAQLIADVLGAKIYRNKYTEIGWYPINLTPEAKSSFIFDALPETFNAFQWHGDTFDIPQGAIRMAENEACQNQAFEFNKRIIGLQFHLESSWESIEALIEHGKDELIKGDYIQTPEIMLSDITKIEQSKKLLYGLMDKIEKLHHNEIVS